MDEATTGLQEGTGGKAPKQVSRRDFLRMAALAGGALAVAACGVPLPAQTEVAPTTLPPPTEPVRKDLGHGAPTEKTTPTEPPTAEPTSAHEQSASPTPDYWVGKVVPPEMLLPDLYYWSNENVKLLALEDPSLKNINNLKESEKWLLPEEYLRAVYRVIAKDENGAITGKDDAPTGFGTSLIFATQAELGLGEGKLIFGITATHIFANEETGRAADRMILRQLHLGKPDIEIPHVAWSPILGLDAGVFVFEKPEDKEIKMFGLDNFSYGVTKDKLSTARALVMPADIHGPGYLGVYGPPDTEVIPPYNSWQGGVHLRMLSARGCSGSAVLNDERRVFAVMHAIYPTVGQDINDPNKYVYNGFGTFADIIPDEAALRQAAGRAWMDYTGKWGSS